MLKCIKKVFKSALLTATIMYGAFITPELHNHYLRHEVGDSVVQVLHTEKNGGGTGFAVQGKSGEHYIMTNRHVCEVKDASGFVRIKHPSLKIDVLRKVIYMDKEHDLCLVDATDLDFDPLTIGSDQSKGDTLYVVGHPGLRKLTLSSGEYIGKTSIELLFEVEKKEDCPGNVYDIPYPWNFIMGKDWLCTKHFQSLETTTLIYGGNSGSPAVNKWGHLVGVAFAGNTEQEHNTFMVPLKYVKAVLNKF